MGGKERILDIGGVPYLIPLAQKHKLYDMRDYPSLTEMKLKEGDEALIVGAGAAPFTYIQRNAEVSISLNLKILSLSVIYNSIQFNINYSIYETLFH